MLIKRYLIYAAYQTTVLRPPMNDGDWLTGLVKYVYATDKPFNCFPSIHVLTSYIVLKASYRCSFERIARAAIFIAAWSIIISTLFVKQHALLDVAGAVLLTEALVFTPIIRHVMPYVVGVHNMSFKRYALFSYTTGLVWTFLFFMIGRYVGDHVQEVGTLFYEHGLRNAITRAN